MPIRSNTQILLIPKIEKDGGQLVSLFSSVFGFFRLFKSAVHNVHNVIMNHLFFLFIILFFLLILIVSMNELLIESSGIVAIQES